MGCHEGFFCPEGAAAALPCPAGEFSNQTGLQSREGCSPCPAGAFCFAGSTAATSCSKGTYAAAERSQLCDACPEGKFQGEEGASACIECGDGYTCPEGSVLQIPAVCDPGTYRDTAAEQCLGCPAGSVCAGGASQPRPCNRGAYCTANVSQPTDCPAGKYQDSEGQTSCKVCPPGRFCEAGSTTPLLCAAGTFGNASGLRGPVDCKDAPPGSYAQAGSTVPTICPTWGFCPGRQADEVNDVRGSIPIVIPDGQQTETQTEIVEQAVNQTVLELPLQVEVVSVNALNETAIRLHVASMLGVPLHAISLDFAASRRRLDHHGTTRSRRLVALDFVVTILDAPTVDISNAESLWKSKSVSVLSAELGVDVLDAPSPVLGTKLTLRNTTVSTVVVVECPPGHWGANGECIPCAKGTYRPSGANGVGCEECVLGTYQPSLGGTECMVCGACHAPSPTRHPSHLAHPFARICAGAGNYSANTLSCEPCQIGEFCVAGTSVGVRCPLAHSTTNGRGARSDTDCVCQVGYYMDKEGCVPCHAMGTNCTAVGVTAATLPLLADWWRLPNSTQLERCFAISNCTGGSDALQLCGEGYEVGSPYNRFHSLTMPYMSSHILAGRLLRCLFEG